MGPVIIIGVCFFKIKMRFQEWKKLDSTIMCSKGYNTVHFWFDFPQVNIVILQPILLKKGPIKCTIQRLVKIKYTRHGNEIKVEPILNSSLLASIC